MTCNIFFWKGPCWGGASPRNCASPDFFVLLLVFLRGPFSLTIMNCISGFCICVSGFLGFPRFPRISSSLFDFRALPLLSSFWGEGLKGSQGMGVVSNDWPDRALLSILYMFKPSCWQMFKPPFLGTPLFPLTLARPAKWKTTISGKAKWVPIRMGLEQQLQ